NRSSGPHVDIVSRVRKAIGPRARLLMSLDLHANISERMVAPCDIVIGYRTNPHVDMIERGEEAAFALRRMLAGLGGPKTAFVRPPPTPASGNPLTPPGPHGAPCGYRHKRPSQHTGGHSQVSPS